MVVPATRLKLDLKNLISVEGNGPWKEQEHLRLLAIVEPPVGASPA